MNELDVNNPDALQRILTEVEDAYFDIPFGNTRFQAEHFVVAAQITPQRAYRAIGLQLHSALMSLRERQRQAEMQQIEIDELRAFIDDTSTNEFDRRRAQIKLRDATESSRWSEKLLRDMIQEFSVYYEHFKKFPRFTREEFEAGERMYFEQSLQRQALGLVGAKESLLNMMDDAKTISNFEEEVRRLPKEELERRLIEVSRSSLAGYLQLKTEEGGV